MWEDNDTRFLAKDTESSSHSMAGLEMWELFGTNPKPHPEMANNN